MYSYDDDNEVVDATDDDVNVFCERHFERCLLSEDDYKDGDGDKSYLGLEIHKRSKY